MLGLLALAAAPWARRAGAQAPRRVGVVSGGGWARDKPSGIALRKALGERGWQDGRDYVYEARSWREPAEVPGLVRDLLRLEVEVIVDLRVARRLGLTVPPAVLLRADQVLE